MQGRKRTLKFASALTVASLAFAACGGDGNNSGKGSEEAKPGDGVVKYMTWESAETNKMLDEFVAANWKNEDIKLERIDAPSGDYSQKLGSLAQAGELPDIFWCGNDTAQQYSQLGNLTDWSDKLGDPLTEEALGGLERWRTDNGLGAIPSLRNVYGVWYNADLFEAAGVPLPKEGWTWDEMFDAAKKLKGAGGSQFGLFGDFLTGGDSPFAMSVYSVSAGGAPFVDNVNKPTEFQIDEKFKEGVTKLRESIAAGDTAPPDTDGSNMASMFAAGRQPMMIGGQWLMQSFNNEAKGIKWGWAPLPVQGDSVTMYDAIGMCSPKDTPKDETWEGVKFLQTEVMPKVMADTLVAPTAYEPGRQGYLDGLAKTNQSVADTVKYNMSTEKTVGNRLTVTWASQVGDQTTAIYLPILKGQRPIEDLDEYLNQVKMVMESNQ